MLNVQLSKSENVSTHGHALYHFQLWPPNDRESMWMDASVMSSVCSSWIRNTYRWRSALLRNKRNHTRGRRQQGLVTEERNTETTPSSEISENALPGVSGLVAKQKSPQGDRRPVNIKKTPLTGASFDLCLLSQDLEVAIVDIFASVGFVALVGFEDPQLDTVHFGVANILGVGFEVVVSQDVAFALLEIVGA